MGWEGAKQTSRAVPSPFPVRAGIFSLSPALLSCPSEGSEQPHIRAARMEVFWVGFQASHCAPGREVSCSKNFPSRCSGG